MNKCDFCSCWNPNARFCSSYTGSLACEEAARKYLQVVKSKNTHTHNKNVNIRKNTKKR